MHSNASICDNILPSPWKTHNEFDNKTARLVKMQHGKEWGLSKNERGQHEPKNMMELQDRGAPAPLLTH